MPFTDPSTPPATTPVHVHSSQAANTATPPCNFASRPPSDGFDSKKQANFSEAIQTISPHDFLKVHQAPCSREGFLTGIGSGATVGCLRYIIGASIPKAANWAVGSGVLISIVAYEWCQQARRIERGNMKRVVEVYAQKRSDQKKQGEDTKELHHQQQELAQEKVQKSWYKLW